MGSRPNVVIVTCHDLGQHLGCYGVETVNSPCLDQLASEGVRFVNSFCTAPQCSPSRSSLYTGRYPHANGVMGLAHGNFAWDFHPGERHVAGILQEAGYHTALVGLQHETMHPEKMGYTDMVVGDEQAHPYCGGVPSSTIAERTAEYVGDVARSHQPFYLQVGFFHPHRPFGLWGVTPDDSRGVSVPDYLVDNAAAREDFAAFQGAIAAMDSATGQIFEALDDAGVRDNTILLFASDHGIPFRRAKCSLFDPGIEVALIIRWPDGGCSGGREYDEWVSNVDYVPTLLDLLDIPVPANVQGRSFAALLNGEEYQPREELFAELTYHGYYDPMRCIRTHGYKLIANFTVAPTPHDYLNEEYGLPGVTPKESGSGYHSPFELYDLSEDPLEFNNLAGDPDYQDVQSDLTRRLAQWMKQTGDPLWEGPPESPLHVRTTTELQQALQD